MKIKNIIIIVLIGVVLAMAMCQGGTPEVEIEMVEVIVTDTVYVPKKIIVEKKVEIIKEVEKIVRIPEVHSSPVTVIEEVEVIKEVPVVKIEEVIVEKMVERKLTAKDSMSIGFGVFDDLLDHVASTISVDFILDKIAKQGEKIDGLRLYVNSSTGYDFSSERWVFIPGISGQYGRMNLGLEYDIRGKTPFLRLGYLLVNNDKNDEK